MSVIIPEKCHRNSTCSILRNTHYEGHPTSSDNDPIKQKLFLYVFQYSPHVIYNIGNLITSSYIFQVAIEMVARQLKNTR